MPALYPSVYSAEDQLNDLVYGASDYPNPNQQVMPTAGIAGGYSSMPAQPVAQEPAAQYPPTTPPPADANYVAQPAPQQAAGPDPFAQQAAPEYDAIDVVGNVDWSGAQQQPWSSTTAPLAPANPAPYTGPNYLSGPQTGDLATMPSQMGFGASGIDQLQRRMNGRQVEPAPYPPTEPQVRELPRAGDGARLLPTATPTPPTMDRRLDVIQQTGGDMSMQQAALRDMYGPNPTQQQPSTLGTEHPDPFLDYQRSTSDIMTLPQQPPQGANFGEGWLGGWDGLTAESRPTADIFMPQVAAAPPAAPAEPQDVLPQSWYDAVDPTPLTQMQDQQATAASDPYRSLRPNWDQAFQDMTTNDFLQNVDAATAEANRGEVGGRSSGAQPGSTPAPAKQLPAMYVLAPDGGLADANDAGSAIAGLGDTGLPTLGVLNLEADGSITINPSVVPKASLDAAAQRGEKAVALSNDEFNAILAAGLMSKPNPDDPNGAPLPLTPEEVEVWRSALVGQPMLAPSEWMPYVADGTEAPPTFTPAEAPAPVVADTSSPSTWNNTYSSNNYRGGGNYYRSSYGGGRGGGGGGSWYGGGGGSYPPSMPASMADFFGPDAFDSPIFDRMRGMMGSRRRGRRRGRRGMPMMSMPGREMPSRDVNLTVQGPVVNAGSAGDEALARALALRNR